MKIGDDIDTGEGPTTLRDLETLDAAEARRWLDIRDGAIDAIDRTGVALYAPAPGTVHRCVRLQELARLTRAARRRVGSRWPEDAN